MSDTVTAEMINQLDSNLELNLDRRAKERLLLYINLLLQGLRKQRLTGERSAQGLIDKHLYDSLYPLKLINLKQDGKILDLGSGGGFPGLPLKICLPRLEMYLADANRRKTMFLQNTSGQLSLDKIYIINDRAENIGRDPEHREQYDYVTCRAVAETAVLAELSLPLLKTGGQAILYKGPRGEAEAAAAEKAIKSCGGYLEKTYDYKLAGGEKRFLLIIKKFESTPSQYPRAVGKPGKKPIRGAAIPEEN